MSGWRSPIQPYSRIREVLPRLAGLSRSVVRERVNANVALEPENLAVLDAVGEFDVTRVGVVGSLGIKCAAYEQFAEFFQARVSQLSRVAACASVGIEERNSKQSARGYDVVAVNRVDSRWFLQYRANGSRVSRDPAYAVDFMQALVGVARLPIESSLDKEGLVVKHSLGGELRVSRCHGPDGRTPSTISCEIAGVDGDEMIVRMKRVVAAASSGKILRQEWSLFARATADGDGIAKDLCIAVAKERGLTGRFEVDAEVIVEAMNPEAYVGLSRMCASGGEISVPLARCSSSRGRDINLELLVRPGGVDVVADVESMDEARAIGLVLGLEFVRLGK